MCIVQDALLGAFKMTLGNKRIRKEQFCDIAIRLDLTTNQIVEKIKLIKAVGKIKGKNLIYKAKKKGKITEHFACKALMSLALPDDFYYEKENKADPEEPVVRIYKGVLYEGALDKSVLGATTNSLIHIIHKEYGPDVTASFIDSVQFISNNWLLIDGFSIGIEDCLSKNKKQDEEIKDVIKKCFIEAEFIKETTSHPGIREVRITGILNKARDMSLKKAKDGIDPNNNFLSTVNSGSKGDFFNVAQITGLLGQQNLQGKRIVPTLNNGTRTLPHYPFEDLPIDLEYESRGFIDSSFIRGLEPRQFYFHAMSGREGCCDTAMNTATSGYIQRKIVKLTEDITIQYDGTVRDAIGSIYQLAYGENFIDPKTTIKVDGIQQSCDIASIANKLNMKYEEKMGSKINKSKDLSEIFGAMKI